jgi:hypothetical protein
MDGNVPALGTAGKSCCGAERIGIHQFAVQHHHAGLAQVTDALRRIAFDEHEVRRLANLD